MNFCHLRRSFCTVGDNYTTFRDICKLGDFANDRAVMAAYGFAASITEAGCVAELFKLYREMVRGWEDEENVQMIVHLLFFIFSSS